MSELSYRNFENVSDLNVRWLDLSGPFKVEFKEGGPTNDTISIFLIFLVGPAGMHPFGSTEIRMPAICIAIETKDKHFSLSH